MSVDSYFQGAQIGNEPSTSVTDDENISDIQAAILCSRTQLVQCSGLWFGNQVDAVLGAQPSILSVREGVISSFR
jgi:hypothetical protein